jgi:hypothetical protein
MLCRPILKAEDMITAYPAFLPTDHSLYRFSDAAFHKQCLDVAPEKEALDNAFAEWKEWLSTLLPRRKSIWQRWKDWMRG